MEKPMSTPDIRWIQRLSNYKKALKRLKEAVELEAERSLSDLEKQGLIQAFEFTHELAWKTIKDFYEYQGESDIQGSRDASRLAFQRGLLENGETWMDMIKNRNLTSHTYDDETAEKIVSAICGQYIHEFIKMEERLTQLKNNE